MGPATVARWDGDSGHAPEFSTFGRDEAAAVAAIAWWRALESALVNPLQTYSDAAQSSFQIWLRPDEFVWIACRRTPGQAYQPATFSTMEEATRGRGDRQVIAWPAAGVKQEYYFNTQNFS